MGLTEEIEATRKEIRTDGYPMSLGELMNMYRDEELVIQPEFQRYFRWKQDQKSRLIESILLGIPVPSIFVSQRQDGVWEVIDGLQRLSTIFEFTGLLRDADGNQVDPLALSRTKYLPSLEGKTWQGDSGLERAQQLLMKRAKINVTIIHRESDPQAKYELFQRLNTGGSPLSPQEIRNCILMMVKPDVLKWLRKLSEVPDFRQSWPFTRKQINEQYHMELIVRFIVFRNFPMDKLDAKLDLDFVLSELIVAMIEGTTVGGTVPLEYANALDMPKEEEAFRKVFADLHTAMGKESFKRFYEDKQEYSGRGLISAYDMLAIAYGGLLDKLDAAPDFNDVKVCLNDGNFQDKTKAGTRAIAKLKVAVEAGRVGMLA